MNITPKQLHILRHSLGVDDNGRGGGYRNHFATSPESDDFADCSALAAVGLMKDHGPVLMWGGMHGFTVTDAGKAVVRENAPKLTRGQRIYQEYLEADSDMSFGEYLKWRHANRERIKALQQPSDTKQTS